jgi:hypothetical protein
LARCSVEPTNNGHYAHLCKDISVSHSYGFRKIRLTRTAVSPYWSLIEVEITCGFLLSCRKGRSLWLKAEPESHASVWVEAGPNCSALLPNQLYSDQDYGFTRPTPPPPRVPIPGSDVCPKNRFEPDENGAKFKLFRPSPPKLQGQDDDLYDQIVVVLDRTDDDPSYEVLEPYTHERNQTKQLPSPKIRSTATTNNFERRNGYKSLLVRSSSSDDGGGKVEPVYAQIDRLSKRNRRRPQAKHLTEKSAESLPLIPNNDNKERSAADRQRSCSPSLRRLRRELRRSRSNGAATQTPAKCGGGERQRHLPPVCGKSPPCHCPPDEELAVRLRIRILKKIASLRRRHIRLRVRAARRRFKNWRINPL